MALSAVIWFLVFSIREADTPLILASILFLCILLGFGFAFLASIQEDDRNPCIAWGPPITTYMMVGKIMTPVTQTPCIQRQNEKDR